MKPQKKLTLTKLEDIYILGDHGTFITATEQDKSVLHVLDLNGKPVCSLPFDDIGTIHFYNGRFNIFTEDDAPSGAIDCNESAIDLNSISQAYTKPKNLKLLCEAITAGGKGRNRNMRQFLDNGFKLGAEPMKALGDEFWDLHWHLVLPYDPSRSMADPPIEEAGLCYVNMIILGSHGMFDQGESTWAVIASSK